MTERGVAAPELGADTEGDEAREETTATASGLGDSDREEAGDGESETEGELAVAAVCVCTLPASERTLRAGELGTEGGGEGSGVEGAENVKDSACCCCCGCG